MEYLQEHSKRVQENKDELLEARELEFAENFYMNTASLFEESFLKMLPSGLQAFPVALQVQTLIKDRVFVEVLEENVIFFF